MTDIETCCETPRVVRGSSRKTPEGSGSETDTPTLVKEKWAALLDLF